MDKTEMKNRTKQFALRVMTMTDHLPSNSKANVIKNQILRSATSVGANYRAALRGRSSAEFIAKLGTVLEEADETAFWLELIEESNLMSAEKLVSLKSEADEICAIIFSTRRSTRENDKS